AREQYEMALSVDSRNLSALYNVAHLLSKLGAAAKEVERRWMEGLSLQPDNQPFMLGYARFLVSEARRGADDALARSELLEKAAAHYHRLLSLAPDSDIARRELATVFLSNGEQDRALDQFCRMHTIIPDDSLLLEELGDYYRSRGLSDGAR